MVLECLGSSSSGNCYLLRAENETLILEVGVDFKEVKKALGWNLSSVVGCLVTHEHNDHAKCIRDVVDNGIRVLALPCVLGAKRVFENPFSKAIEAFKGYKVGGFKIMTFSVEHDVPCLGYVIDHEEMGRMVFITDTMLMPYKIPSVNHLLIEANYSDEILQENIDNGLAPKSLRDRIMHSHMELKTTLRAIKDNVCQDTQEVVLLHLSGQNSSAAQFITEAKKVAAKPCYAARKGFTIELTNIQDGSKT